MKTKKIISVLLIVCMTVGLFACTNNSNQNAEVNAPVENPQVIEEPSDDPVHYEYPSSPSDNTDQNWTLIVPEPGPFEDVPEESPNEEPVVEIPEEEPTQDPTSEQTQTQPEDVQQTPAAEQTQAPAQTQTQAPTQKPTEAPTQKPTQNPTQAPTQAPTAKPTQAPTPAPTETPTEQPEDTYAPKEATLKGDFTRDLEKFIKKNGYKNKNYIVSPTSYRAALCLAIAGANGDTKDRLIKAAGFSSQAEANSWYNGIISSIASFKGEEGNFFEIANAIWNNTNYASNFKKSYVDYVSSHYNTTASALPGSQLMRAINSWCEEKTHGMIKEIVDSDIADAVAVLANALYLKSNWKIPFEESQTKSDVFHTISGTEVTKSFMNITDKFRYYKDDNTKLIIIPLEGKKSLVCVIGDTGSLSNKISHASITKVHLSIPKMDIETSLEDNELVKFLEERGAGDAFNPIHADFTEMYDKESGLNWYIDTIIQKAKIKTDENGLEAAAVTAIVMKGTSVDTNMPEEFIANEPFSFYVLDENNNEILFFGQMVK